MRCLLISETVYYGEENEYTTSLFDSIRHTTCGTSINSVCLAFCFFPPFASRGALHHCTFKVRVLKHLINVRGTEVQWLNKLHNVTEAFKERVMYQKNVASALSYLDCG